MGLDWGMTLLLRLGIGGSGSGIVNGDRGLGIGHLVFGIGYWDWRLGIRIRDW